ncbi:MAG: glycoside hydrolase family 88 protein [Thermoleophilaceae bacterium]|nr:glycoside hydrolase family 88 protein [Thermoleophilaceae bacterium]
MSATRPPLTLRIAASTAIIFALLLAGMLLHARAASAATSGPNAFSSEASLLKKRVQQIGLQTPAGRYPIGTGLDGQLRFAEGWTSGFWAGTLWRVADLNRSDASLDAALEATVDHYGFEQTQLHDLGFMYGESSVAAHTRMCSSANAIPECKKLRASGMLATYTLVKLARTTGQGIIPLGAKTCSDCKNGGAETIVDSMMNLPLLYWATKTTGNKKYRNLAFKHANWVAANLVRKDGSTYQSASYPRRAKTPELEKHTHQGLRDSSTWSRGQAWSIYGFADAGREFRSRALLRVAERNANYVAAQLPTDGLPPWDYDAPAGAPRDVSAGVITAAGLFHLANACAAVREGCVDAKRWSALARKILKGSLARIRTTAPVGYLGSQVYRLGGKDSWDDDAELVLGLNYALEAIKLSRAPQK